MNIDIAIISTKKYKTFLPKLFIEIEKHFLVGHNRTIHLFTDSHIPNIVCSVKIVQHIIPSYGYPEATLLRYKIILESQYKSDYFFYLDSDMGIVSTIGDELLSEFIAVRHPGYFSKGGGSWETNEKSQCYVPPNKRLNYFAGGIQGGKTSLFIPIMKIMKGWIDMDLSNGIIPIWHDESAYNCFITMCDFVTSFHPGYCMPEAMSKRIAWGIADIPPKILALEKPKNFRL